MKKALRKAAGNLSLYLLVTSTPPSTVAALLANVNCKNKKKQNFTNTATVSVGEHVHRNHFKKTRHIFSPLNIGSETNSFHVKCEIDKVDWAFGGGVEQTDLEEPQHRVSDPKKRLWYCLRRCVA